MSIFSHVPCPNGCTSKELQLILSTEWNSIKLNCAECGAFQKDITLNEDEAVKLNDVLIRYASSITQ